MIIWYYMFFSLIEVNIRYRYILFWPNTSSKPHGVYTFFVSTCEWTGSLDDSKITAGVPLKLASWPAYLWKLGLDVFSIGKRRGFMNCYPFWAGDFQDLMLEYMVMSVYGPFFLQTPANPNLNVLGTTLCRNVFYRKCRNTCNSTCGSWVYEDIFIFLNIHIDLVYFFFAHTCCKSPQSCVYRFMCVYHKVCYLLVVFLRCPHSNPESFSQHVGQADGLHHFPACPLYRFLMFLF